MKKTGFIVLLSFVSGLTGAYVFNKSGRSGNDSKGSYNKSELDANRALLASFNDKFHEGGFNFILASKVSTPSVVFIKTTAMVKQRSPFGWYFDDWDPFGSIGQVSSTGSGVIVRKDGYIVTNLHVVKDAQTIEVVLNNQKKNMSATLVGSDPSTDLAVLKIDASDLPAVNVGNSDELQIGQWVVAVGNPFNLTSTVTAGIVSAKGRNINVVNNQFPIESFIQTDAAINPGNSGGALVDLNGNLVGINTAIFSKTGSYSGYGFAIPSNIVTKVVKDLIEFGFVQRGYTGIDVVDIDDKIQKNTKSNIQNGAYVVGVLTDGPGDKSGIKTGDIIVKIQDRPIESKAIFDESISYYRPGDKLKILYFRDGSQKETTMTLTNTDGELSLTTKTTVKSVKLGGEFSPVSKLDKSRYNITNGVKVTGITGGMLGRMGLEDGFIFTKFNGKAVTDPNVLITEMESSNGRMQIEGIGTDGGHRYYNYY